MRGVRVRKIAAAVSPREGEHLAKYLIDGKFRENLRNGNFYEEDDYLNLIDGLFRHFELDLSARETAS